MYMRIMRFCFIYVSFDIKEKVLFSFFFGRDLIGACAVLFEKFSVREIYCSWILCSVLFFYAEHPNVTREGLR